MKLSVFPDSSGISATEIEPIIVPGIVTIGRAMPVTTPKNATALEDDVPDRTSIAGKIIDMSKLTRLVPILNIAIGADSAIKGLTSLIDGVILLPLTKYIMIAIMLESAQAIE